MINGDTKIIGFVGSTYKFSKMYALYNSTFKYLNLNYIYVPLIVDDIAKGVAGIRDLGIHAAGITIPFKNSIIPYLDELDEVSKVTQSVAVVLNKSGHLVGSTTDGQGAILALKEKTDLKNKNVIIIGAGGAASAITYSLIQEKVANVCIVNRTKEKAADLANKFNCKYEDLAGLGKLLQENDIVINATSVGMSPNENESLIAANLLKPEHVIFDLVTQPRETKLLKEAQERGCTVVYGYRMLYWQSVLKFKLYTGIEAPLEYMNHIIEKFK